MKSSTSVINNFRTSPASPLSTPRSLRIPEELIKCIRNYIFSAFEKEIWVLVGDLQDIETKREKNDALVDFVECNSYGLAVWEVSTIYTVGLR